MHMGGAVARMFVRAIQSAPEELGRSAREQLALCVPTHHAAASTGPEPLWLCLPLAVPSPGPASPHSPQRLDSSCCVRRLSLLSCATSSAGALPQHLVLFSRHGIVRQVCCVVQTSFFPSRDCVLAGMMRCWMSTDSMCTRCAAAALRLSAPTADASCTPSCWCAPSAQQAALACGRVCMRRPCTLDRIASSRVAACCCHKLTSPWQGQACVRAGASCS